MDRALIAGNIVPLLQDDAGNYWPASNEGLDGFNVVGIQSSSLDLLRQVPITLGATGVTTTGPQSITPSAMSGTTDDGIAWSIAAGTTLLIDVGGANQEAVVVTTANSTSFTANFTKTHSSGVTVYVDTFFRTRQAPGQRGAVLMSSDGYKATYRYYSSGNTPAATPTDVFTLAGSATKTVRVKKVTLSGLATTAGQFVWNLIRRSAANTGGTSSAPAAMKHDTLDAAASAVMALYTVNPTGLGTTVGTVRGGRLFHALSTAQNDRLEFNFCNLQDKALILRGTSDILAVNGAGGTLPAGATLDIEVEWEEDNS